MSASTIDSRVRIGHIQLKVADLERSISFYRDALGFEVVQRLGNSAAFLSAGGYHHNIGLNAWKDLDGTPPPARHAGMYHTAILYPDRAALASALKRLLDAGVSLDKATDHGVSETIYLHDPDQNEVELYRDRPVSEWPRGANGDLAMFTKPIDLGNLLAEVNE